MFKGVFILKKMAAFKQFVSTALICSFLTVNVPLVGTSGQKVDAMEDTTMTHVSDYSGSKADYFLQVDAGNQLFDLSNLMYGIFLEDINASCDGGLSAEMVENRSFEYGTRYGCKPDFKWNSVGDIKKNIRDGSKDNTALNKNNPHYMVLTNESGQMAGLENEGYLDGMAIRNDMKYQFSVYAKGLEGFSGDLQVDLMVEGKSVASEKISGITENWEKYELELAPSKTASSTNENKSVKLQVTMNQGSCALDMVSLMPQNNIGGFRADLVNNLKEMTPSFFRFPGGCVTEGTSTPDDAYNWKQSIGCDQDGEPLKFQGVYGDEAARRIGENNDWNYYMSYDLGFYEYFELCEYLNTLPIPVLNAGLGCDVRGAKGAHTGEELQKDIQTALDLVEFCRGDESTKWGAVRISMGYKEPFQLKYIGIGNEQNSDNYFNNYSEFVKAFAKEAKENPKMYGDIQLVMSPIICEGTGWYKSTLQKPYKFADSWLKDNPEYSAEQWASCYDHHNYNTPEWFFKNCDYFAPNNYSRTDCNGKYGGKFDVFLGEYAAHVEDTPNALEEALAEAACMTSLEQNGDIVKMACYAPLFCSVNKVNWKWNMIYFDNDENVKTTNYYAQKMFMNHIGTKQLYSRLMGAENIVSKKFSGEMQFSLKNAQADFKNIQITDEKNGEVYKETDFSLENASDWYKLKDRKLDHYTVEADLIQTDEEGEYTIKLSGKSISFKNSKSAHLRIEVDQKQMKCYINGVQCGYATVGDTDAQAYQSVNLDENGDIIIKLVNVTDKERTFGVSVKNAVGVKDTEVAYCLAGNSLKDKNEIGVSDNIETKEETVTGLKEQFNYTVPKYSITILRVPTDGTQDQPTDPTKSPLPVKSPVATKSPTPTATPTVSPTPTAPSVPTTSPVPNVVPDASPNPIEKQVSVIKKGKSFSQGDIQYQVTKTGKQASVSITGTTAKGKKKSRIKIGKKVDFNGTTFLITDIAKGAFRNHKKLKEITIGKNVKSIGANAFAGDKKLSKVIIQSIGLKQIGSKAFAKKPKGVKVYLYSKKYKSYKKMIKKKV